MVWYSKLWVKICLLVIVAGSAIGVYAYYVLFLSINDLKVSITSEPLKFSMELDKSKYLYGENMTINFRLENMGNEMATIWRTNPDYWHRDYTETSYHNVHVSLNKQSLSEFHFGFIISYANGTEFLEVGHSSLPFGYKLDIDPSGWIEQTITARIIGGLEDLESHHYILTLPRDTYQIKGVFRYHLDQPPYITLETPSITFVIQ